MSIKVQTDDQRVLMHKTAVFQTLTQNYVRIMAIIIAMIGLLALIFEVRNLVFNAFDVYIARLFTVVIAFVILVLGNTESWKLKSTHLAHLLVSSVVLSSMFVIHRLPSTFQINSLLIASAIFVFSLALGWRVIHQYIVVFYSVTALGLLVLLNQSLFSEAVKVPENLTAYLILSLFSIITSKIVYSSREILFKTSGGNGIQIIDAQVRMHELLQIQDLFDNLSEGLFRFLPDGRVTFANQSFLNILGYEDKVELKDIPIETLFVEPKEYASLLTFLKHQKKVKYFRASFYKKDKTIIIVRLSLRYSQDQNEPPYFDGILQDVTQKIKLEEEKERELKELKEEKKKSLAEIHSAVYDVNRKSEYLASMSHEIKTPLNSVIGFLDLIEQSGFDSKEELLDFASKAKSSANALMGIVLNILDISKIEAGKLELDEENFNLKAEVDNCCSILIPTANEKGLSLKREFDSNIPELVKGDQLRFRQILLNLLSNSVKYTNKGGVGISISLEEKSELTTKLKIIVKDSGVGIPQSKLPFLFKPYSRIKEMGAQKSEGTGLGLVITKELISLMNGSIDVLSEVNVGTRFEVLIQFKNSSEKELKEFSLTSKKAEKPTIDLEPKVEPEISEPQLVVAGIEAAEDDLALRKNYSERKRLLLVEDNPISQKLEIRILNSAGYNVDAVSDGYQAIEAVKKNIYDLVLMDIEMPNLDGLSATQKIRELDNPAKNIPIIAVTAHSSMKDREKCLAVGMNDYIAKPININFMKMTIDQWVKKVPSAE
ncbi:MAG: response regulator [Bacteroidetes bacterium]|nr:response regulator [Bacteroidota bacterium]